MCMQHAEEFIVCNTVLCINKYLWLQCEKEFVNNISYMISMHVFHINSIISVKIIKDGYCLYDCDGLFFIVNQLGQKTPLCASLRQ